MAPKTSAKPGYLAILSKAGAEPVSISEAIESAADGELGDQAIYDLAMWLDKEFDSRRRLEESIPHDEFLVRTPLGICGGETLADALETAGKLFPAPLTSPGSPGYAAVLWKSGDRVWTLSWRESLARNAIRRTKGDEGPFDGLPPVAFEEFFIEPVPLSDSCEEADDGPDFVPLSLAAIEGEGEIRQSAEGPPGLAAYEAAIAMHYENPVRIHDPELGRSVAIPLEESQSRVDCIDPQPGDRVHYINPGDLTGKYPPKISPAIVIGPGSEPDTLHLFVITSAPGHYYNNNVSYGPRPGCWIWPVY